MKYILLGLLMFSKTLFPQTNDIFLGPTLSSEAGNGGTPEEYYPLGLGMEWDYEIAEESIKSELIRTSTVTVRIINKLKIEQGTIYLREVFFSGESALNPEPGNDYQRMVFGFHILVVGSYVYSVPFPWWDEKNNEILESFKDKFECIDNKGLIPDYFFPLQEGICWRNPKCEKEQIESRPAYQQAMIRVKKNTPKMGDYALIKKYQGFFNGTRRIESQKTIKVGSQIFEDAWFLELDKLGGGSTCFFKEGIGPIFLSVSRGGSSSRRLSASLIAFRGNGTD